MNAREEYRYNRLTWPEMNEAIAMQKVVILPTGSTEQHGRHLPLDTDVLLCESVCLEVGKRAADRVLVLPPISYGLNMHHIDFPGTIHIEPEVFISFCLNITKSVAYHGFEKILIVFWGRWTDLGVHGDPRCATAEKGEIVFEAAVAGLIEAVDEIKAWPIEKRQDQHSGPVQSQIRW